MARLALLVFFSGKFVSAFNSQYLRQCPSKDALALKIFLTPPRFWTHPTPLSTNYTGRAYSLFLDQTCGTVSRPNCERYRVFLFFAENWRHIRSMCYCCHAHLWCRTNLLDINVRIIIIVIIMIIWSRNSSVVNLRGNLKWRNAVTSLRIRHYLLTTL